MYKTVLIKSFVGRMEKLFHVRLRRFQHCYSVNKRGVQFVYRRNGTDIFIHASKIQLERSRV